MESGAFKNNLLIKGLNTQKLLIAYFFAITTLTMVGWFSFHTVQQLTDDFKNVESVYHNIRELDEVIAGVSLGQTELRAYFLTSNPEYLKLYRFRLDSIHRHLSIITLSMTDGDQRPRVHLLDSLVRLREQFNREKIDVFERYGADYADEKFPVDKSQAIVRQIDSLIFFMENLEKDLLTERKLKTANQTNRTLILTAFGGIISVLLLLIVFVFLNNEIRQRKKIEKEVRTSEKRFLSFLEAVPAGIYILTADGKPYYANEEATKILGKGIVPDATAQTLTEVYQAYRLGTDTPYPAEQMPIVRALSGERSTISDIEIWKTDVVVPLLITGAPIYDSDGVLQYAMAAFIDISTQKKAEQELAASEERFRQIVESATDIIYRTDRNGHLTYVNPVGLKVFGYSKDEAIGTHYLDVITAENVDLVKRFYLRQALTRTKQSYYEFNAVTKSGMKIVLGQNVQLLIEGERVTGFLAVARDISEKKRHEVELKEAKDAAESATLAKSQFLATMSHEIRTPMNGVIGMTDLLLQTDLNGEQREYTEIIRTSGETLLTLINDILDFSKIESGKLDMEKRPIELQSLVEETFDLVARRAVEKRLDLIYLIDPSAPQYIIGDSVRLRQILLNLTNNAIKFTEKGEVFVTVKEVSRNGDMTTLRFSVKDTGIGIPKEKIEKLFQAFSQVDASTTRKYGGTGLGLAITKRLVELMDGEVWIESEEGKGSTFHFTIVVPTTSSADSLPKKYVRGKIPELQGKRLLLVDDNETNLNILSIQCSNWGMHPRSTTSQQEALKWLAGNDPFDVVVLDFHMPEMNGVELARSIRKIRDAQQLPIVLFSSSGRTDFSETENRLFAAVILKPMKQSQLYSTLIDVLSANGHVRSSTAVPQIKVQALGESFPLTILVAEDNLVNQKLAFRLLQQLGYRADIASNGKIVLEMLKKNKYDVILMDLHMPEMDGLEATRMIVATTEAQNRPKIIAMTADAMSGDREKCIDAGMDDYISKPVRLDGLRDMLLHYGEMIIEQRSGKRESAPLDTMYERLKELLEQTDAEFLTEFVQSYPSQSEEMFGHLRSAWDRKDTKDIVFAAHKLRGLALSFGADELAELCKEIELNIEQNPGDITEQRLSAVQRSLNRSYDTLAKTISALGIA